MAEDETEPSRAEWADVLKFVALVYAAIMAIVWTTTGQWRFDVWNAGQKATPTTAQVRRAAPSTQLLRGPACNPNYTGCVPNSRGDVNCPQVLGPVLVTGIDVYHLDGDGDGVGCEG